MNEINKADFVILVTDLPELDQQDKKILQENKIKNDKLIIVHNKTDLHKHPPKKQKEKETNHIHLSAKTGEGVGTLLESLLSLAELCNTGEDVILARERHIKAIEAALNIIEKSIDDFNTKPRAELLAESLRRVQMELSRITGEVTPDDLLSEIFSTFCIGK